LEEKVEPINSQGESLDSIGEKLIAAGAGAEINNIAPDDCVESMNEIPVIPDGGRPHSGVTLGRVQTLSTEQASV
jgi:hypothetical protein